MNCAVHSEVVATGFCRNCGKAMCGACAHEVRGALYCEPCLAGLVTGPPAVQPAVTADAHPGVALALGFIPGLGAVYNGEYIKALVQVLAFAGVIEAQTHDISAGAHAFLGIALGCFYFYMPIDAYRTAKARLERAADTSGTGLSVERRPVGAMILIGLGALLLLGNFGLLQWDWFGRVWPVGLILLGAWLLFARFYGKSTEKAP